MKRTVVFGLCVVLTCSGLSGCGDDGNSSELSDAQGETETEQQPIVPMAGVWQSVGMGFSVEEGRIKQLSFQGFGCIGPVTLAGVPTCESRLNGDLELDVSILKNTPKFNMDTIFGLHLEGEFTADDRVTGVFSYTADNGCCTSAGTWEGVHESLYEAEPPIPCHSQITGDEVVEFGQETDAETPFEPMKPNGTVTAVTGFQGAIMVVLALRVSGLSLGGLSVSLDISIDGGKVVSKLTSDAPKFKDQGDGTWVWPNLYLILEDDEGNLLHPTDPAQVALLQNRTATVTVKVDNPCGFSKQVSLDVTTQY